MFEKYRNKLYPIGLEKIYWPFIFYGGADETRTRDLRRDRPAF